VHTSHDAAPRHDEQSKDLEDLKFMYKQYQQANRDTHEEFITASKLSFGGSSEDPRIGNEQLRQQLTGEAPPELDFRTSVNLSFAQAKIEKLKEHNSFLQQSLEEMKALEEENRYLSSKVSEYQSSLNAIALEHQAEISRLQAQLSHSEATRIKLQNQNMEQNKAIKHLHAKFSTLEQKVKMMNQHQMTLQPFHQRNINGLHKQTQTDRPAEIDVHRLQVSQPKPAASESGDFARHKTADSKSQGREPSSSPKPILRNNSAKKQVTFTQDVKRNPEVEKVSVEAPQKPPNEMYSKSGQPMMPDIVEKVTYQLPDGRRVNNEEFERYKKEKMDAAMKSVTQVQKDRSHPYEQRQTEHPQMRQSQTSYGKPHPASVTSREEPQLEHADEHEAERSERKHKKRDRSSKHREHDYRQAEEDEEEAIKIEVKKKHRSSRHHDDDGHEERRHRSKKKKESRSRKDTTEDDPNIYFENGKMVRMHYPAEYHPLAALPSDTHKNSDQPLLKKPDAAKEQIKDDRFLLADTGTKLSDLPIWPNPKSPLYGMVKSPNPTAAFNSKYSVLDPETKTPTTTSDKFNPKSFISDIDIKSIVEKGFNKILEQHNLTTFTPSISSSSSIKDFSLASQQPAQQSAAFDRQTSGIDTMKLIQGYSSSYNFRSKY